MKMMPPWTAGAATEQKPKFEVRDPKEIRNPKPESSCFSGQSRRVFPTPPPKRISAFAFRISFGFREFGLRISGQTCPPGLTQTSAQFPRRRLNHSTITVS